jgi:hypothetical protein
LKTVLCGRGAAGSAAIKSLSKEMSFLAMTPACQRLAQIAALRERGERIDDNEGAAHAVIVGFPHAGREAADQIQVAAGFEPAAFDERVLRQRRAADHVRRSHSGLEIARGRHGPSPSVEISSRGRCLVWISAPDED